MQTKNVIRNIYLYLVSAVSLFMIVFSVVSLVNLGLRTWVFPKADNNYYYPTGPCTVDKSGKSICPDDAEQKAAAEENKLVQRQRDLVQNISFLIVAVPLFSYHWMVIRKDRKNIQE